MHKPLYGTDRKRLKNRFVSCAVLGLYMFALVVMPVWHVHGCEHGAGTCCEHFQPESTVDSDDVCSICEFAHLTVPFFAVSDSILVQTDAVSTMALLVSTPAVTHAAGLPPCRAPPVLY